MTYLTVLKPPCPSCTWTSSVCIWGGGDRYSDGGGVLCCETSDEVTSDGVTSDCVSSDLTSDWTSG